MRTGKQLIGTQLAELRGQSSPPPALRDMQAPLRANFATLDQIYAVGITKAGYDERADRALRGRGAQRRHGRDDARHRRARLRAPGGPIAEPGRARLGRRHPAAAGSRSASTTAARPGRAPSPRTSPRRTSACWPPAARRRSPTPSPAWQPPRADRRPRDDVSAAGDERPQRARALRPRRLQAVQRQLRPPGRRRAARRAWPSA